MNGLPFIRFRAASVATGAQNALNPRRRHARAIAVDATVLGEGEWADIDARDLVRGDVILLREGELAPADFVVSSAEGPARAEYVYFPGGR